MPGILASFHFESPAPSTPKNAPNLAGVTQPEESAVKLCNWVECWYLRFPPPRQTSETQDFANKTAEASRIPADQLTCQAGDLV